MLRFVSTLCAILLTTSISYGKTSSKCLITKAGFDIGSGSTKMKVALVDKCNRKIIKMLIDTSEYVGYKKDLKTRDYFSDEIMKKGLKTLNTLMTKANKFKNVQFKAVATSAFRKAKNAKSFVSKIKNQLNLNVVIINQKTEAKLGFIASANKLNKSIKNIVIWDIGGGSMQLTTLENNDQLNIYEGKTASVSFRNSVIQKIQKKDLLKVESPNPINNNDERLAFMLAKEIATQDISQSFKNKINEKNTEIIGIGGVHYYSIKNQVKTKNNFYTFKQVTDILKERLNLTDKEIGGKYASTEITNLILVKGFMSALNIKKVRTEKINMCDALLIQ